MIDYEKMILQWQNSVLQYCNNRGIANMELKNLRQGVFYNYELYVAYKQVQSAIECYRKTPSSFVYANQMVAAIKKWYLLNSDNKLQKLSMQIMPNEMFARFIQRIK